MSLPNLDDLKKIHYINEEIENLEQKLSKLQEEKKELEIKYKHQKEELKVSIKKDIKDKINLEKQTNLLIQSQEQEKQALENFIISAEKTLDKYFGSQDFVNFIQDLILKLIAENNNEKDKIEIYADANFLELVKKVKAIKENKLLVNGSNKWPLAVKVNSKIYELSPNSLKSMLMPKLLIEAFQNK